MAAQTTRIVISAEDRTKPAFASARRNLSDLASSGAGLARSLASAVPAIGALAGAVSFAGLAAGLRSAVAEAEKFERLSLRTEAVIRATGGTAGLTANEIRKFSEELALGTLASVEGVEAAAQKLLTFRSVTGEVFRDTMRLAQDLAAVGFGTLESNVVQLGKALEDPIKGISALREVGVSFSATQREQIRLFVEQGRVAEAQREVLKALEVQVGGAGAAEAGGLSGAYDTLAQNVQTFLRNIGDAGPITAAKGAIDGLARSISNLNATFFKSGRAQVDALVARRQELQEYLDGSPARLRQGREERIAPLISDINAQIAALQNLRVEEQKGEAAARRAEQAGAIARQKEFEAEKQRERREAAAKGRRGGSAKASIDRSDPLGDFAKDADERIQPALHSLERFRDMQLSAAVAGADLTQAERALYDIINSPEWESMSEPWRALVMEQYEAANSAERTADAQARLSELLAATPTSQLEKLRSEMQFLADAFERGQISAEQFTEAAQTRLGTLGDKLSETTDSMTVFADQAARNMQSAFADFLFDPFDEGLDGMLKSFGKTLQRMVAEQASAQLFKSIGKWGSDNSGAGGALGFFGSIASMFGGGKAVGGPVSAGKTYLVGEEGPELLTMGANSGYITPNDKLGSGRTINLTVNVASGTPVEVKRAAGAGAREALAAFNGAQRYA